MSWRRGQKGKSPRKIFIDVGANCGNSFLKIKQSKPNGVLQGPDWVTYLWEANPQMIKFFLNDLKANHPDHKIHIVDKAAYTQDTTLNFYLTTGQEDVMDKSQFLDKGACDPNSIKNPSGASTLIDGAKRAGKPVLVQALDFTKWMIDLDLTQDDTVALKMDIEGAEKDLLSKMMDTPNSPICLVDVMWMEFHGHIFHEGSQTKREYTAWQQGFATEFERRCGRKLHLMGWH